MKKWKMYKHLARYCPVLLATLLLLPACEEPAVDLDASFPEENWQLRIVDLAGRDSLAGGSTYLASYSQIYTQTKARKISLTATVSMRNINVQDTVFIDGADYYNTNGTLVRRYFKRPVYLAPLETVEIVLAESDIEGGTGDNFVFNWSKPAGTHDPVFEGVFISTYGQQGISFVTRGIRIE